MTTLTKRIEPTTTGYTCYLNNTPVGSRPTEAAARDYLNELVYDVERGRPVSELVSAAAPLPAPAGVTVTRSPHVAATVYTHGDVRLYDEDGNGLASLSACGTVFDFLHKPAHLDELRSIWHILNHPAVAALLGIDALVVPAVQVVRDVCDDEYDSRYGSAIATNFVCGVGDAAVEVWIPDAPCNIHNRPILYAFGDADGVYLDEVDRVLPNITAVMQDARVKAARDRAEAGLPPFKLVA